MPWRSRRSIRHPQDQTPHDNAIYFSLDNQSPSLNSTGTIYSSADILVSPPLAAGFGLFAPAPALGLSPADEVDALAVWDLGIQYEADQGDCALFSLAPGSPYLVGPDGVWGSGDDYSAADIFVTDLTGSNAVFLNAMTIGMQFEDNVDAIDVESELMAMEEEPLDRVAPLPLPPWADGDNDGDVDGGDFLVWQRGYMKTGPGLTLADGDFNREDVIVDIVDLNVWRSQYPTPTVPVTSAVPEPTTGLLMALGLLLVGASRRRG